MKVEDKHIKALVYHCIHYHGWHHFLNGEGEDYVKDLVFVKKKGIKLEVTGDEVAVEVRSTRQAIIWLYVLFTEHFKKQESLVLYLCRDNQEVLIEEWAPGDLEDRDFMMLYEKFDDELEIYIGYD